MMSGAGFFLVCGEMLVCVVVIPAQAVIKLIPNFKKLRAMVARQPHISRAIAAPFPDTVAGPL